MSSTDLPAGALPSVRLIASDLDGTLLRRDGTVSARTRRALWRAQVAGITVVLVTGRPARQVRAVAQAAGVAGLAICSDGAVVYDPERDLIVQHTPFSADVARRLVVALRAAAPGVCFACELGTHYACEPGYVELAPHVAADVPRMEDALALCATPIIKLIMRHPTLEGDALAEVVQTAVGGAAHVTTYVNASGLPFVELSAPGVHKARALEALCGQLGVRQEEVIAFGDMPNDLPLLRWAGHAVAVANAHPTVLAVADEVARSNEEDGVARVIERLVRAARTPSAR